MATNGDYWRQHAEQRGIPERTLAQVQAAIAEAKKTNSDRSLARLMLRHGRMTSAGPKRP